MLPLIRQPGAKIIKMFGEEPVSDSRSHGARYYQITWIKPVRWISLLDPGAIDRGRSGWWAVCLVSNRDDSDFTLT
jgi:hypothetical protein